MLDEVGEAGCVHSGGHSFAAVHAMAIFLRRLSVFLLPLALVFGAWEILLRRIPNDYSFKREQLDLSAGRLEVLVLGSSPSYDAVDPALLGGLGFNAANIAQTYAHDRAILERYIDRMPKLEWIVLDAGYASFRPNPLKSKERWRAKNYAMYFGFWRFAQQPSDMVELLNRPLPQQWDMVRDHLCCAKDNRLCNDDGVRSAPPVPTLDLDKDGRERVAQHTLAGPGALATKVKDLRAIAEAAKAHNVRVYLHSPPCWPTYRQGMEPGQLKEATDQCERLAREFPNVIYHDHLADTGYVRSDLLNGNHLSASGAAKYSAAIAAGMRAAEAR